MEFYDVIRSRRTIRDFEDTAIEEAVIERIISAAMKAPTNDHMRDWHFIVIQDKEVVTELINKIPKNVSQKTISTVLKKWNLNDPCQQDLYKNAIPKQHRMLLEAACVIIPLFKQETDLLHPDNLSHLNGFASIWCSIENLLLATTAEGYAATFRIPLGNEDKWARSVLNFPEEYMMPCFIGIGKPRADATPIVQIERDLNTVIHKDKW